MLCSCIMSTFLQVVNTFKLADKPDRARTGNTYEIKNVLLKLQLIMLIFLGVFEVDYLLNISEHLLFKDYKTGFPLCR